jgi:hypothetical protein
MSGFVEEVNVIDDARPGYGKVSIFTLGEITSVHFALFVLK